MGNRRLGRKRLFSLEKKGQENPNRPAPGIAPAVVYSKSSRDGSQITTEIVLDLASSKGALSSPGHATNNIIGISSSVEDYVAQGNAHLAAHLGRITTAVNGIVTDAEIICTETPTDGEPHFDLAYKNSATLGFGGASGTDLLVDSGADYVIGLNKSGQVNDNSAAGDYLYLGAAATDGDVYATGKIIIRIYGYAVENDL